MSIEQNLAALTAAIADLAAAMRGNAQIAQQIVQSTPAPAPVATTIAAPAPVAMQMPAPPVFTAPTFAPPVSVPTSSVAPFSDGQGLIAYVMDAYKTMGPAKGAGIQGVLTSIGVANINDVKPEQYGTLFAGVEALKRS